MTKLKPKMLAVKNDLWAWLKTNELLTDTWWESDDTGNLLVFFEGDFYDVIWSNGRGPKAAELEGQLRDLLKRRGCWFVPKDETCIRIYANEDDPAQEYEP